MTTAMQEGLILKALARFKMLLEYETVLQETLDEQEAEPPRATIRMTANANEDLHSATEKHTDVVKDYLQLATLPTLSDEDIDRMDAILEQAESDTALSFRIGEADYLIGQRMGLFSADDPNAFADQQAWLRSRSVQVSNLPCSDLAPEKMYC